MLDVWWTNKPMKMIVKKIITKNTTFFVGILFLILKNMYQHAPGLNILCHLLYGKETNKF